MEFTSEQTICFLGGSKFMLDFPTVYKAQKVVENLLLDIAPKRIYSTIEPGIELYSAKMAYKIGIPYVAVIPYHLRDVMWADEIKNEYNKYIDKSEQEIYLSDRIWNSDCFFKAAKIAIDDSDIFVAFIFKNSGVFTTQDLMASVEYARLKGKQVIVVDENYIQKLGYKR